MDRMNIRKEIFDHIRTEIRLFLKSKRLWIFAILIVAAYSYYVYLISDYSAQIGNILTSLGLFVTHCLILIGLLFGISSISFWKRKEDDNQIANLKFYDLIFVLIGKIVLVILTGMFLFLISVILVSVIFILKDAPKYYYIRNVGYVLLYWVIPFTISSFIGLALEIIIRKRVVSYILGIIIAVFIGPCMPDILGLALGRGNKNLLCEIYKVINLGDINAHTYINESFGYTLSCEVWLSRLCILSSVLFILLSLMLQTGKKKTLFRLGFITMAGIIAFIGFSLNSRIQNMEPDDRYYKFWECYKDNPEPDHAKYTDDNKAYVIKGYNICIDGGLDLDIDAEIDLNIIKPESRLVFTLYHEFEISSVMLNGDECGYRQTGDALIVENEKRCTGENTISVKYRGIPPLNLYRASDKWILPAMFAWYPVEYIGKTIEMESIYAYIPIFINSDHKSKVPISIYYSGSNEVFCSLKETGNNSWQGVSSSATLCCGWFKEEEMNGTKVVYPALCENNPEQAASLLECLKNEVPLISLELLGEQKTVNSDKIFIFPTILQNGFGDDIYLYEDHVVCCLYLDQDGSLIKQMDGAPAVMSVIRKDGWYQNDKELRTVFSYTYMKSLHERGLYNGEWYVSGGWDKYIEKMIESIEENQKKYDVADLARKISEIIDSGDEEKQIRVFRAFNRLMTSGVPMEEVTEEMKKYTEE